MPIRPLYEATVLLGGSRDNSVHIPNATAVELYVLRAIHGENETGTNPITNVKPLSKGVDRTDEQERARIGARYTAPGKAGGIAILNALYGVGNKLPVEYAAPASGDPGDAPLVGEEEHFVDLDPKGPITSLPEPEPEPVKKTKKAVFDDD